MQPILPEKRGVCEFSARIALLALLVHFVAACADGGAKGLLGCYSGSEGGNAAMKVLSAEGKYLLSMAPPWTTGTEMTEPSTDEAKKIFEEDFKYYVSGLKASGMGVFKVKKGMPLPDKGAVKGSYVAVLMFGGGEVYKVPCPAK